MTTPTDNQLLLDLLENKDALIHGGWFNPRRKKQLTLTYVQAQRLESKSFTISVELVQILRTAYAYKEGAMKYFGADFLHAQLQGVQRLRKLKLLTDD